MILLEEFLKDEFMSFLVLPLKSLFLAGSLMCKLDLLYIPPKLNYETSMKSDISREKQLSKFSQSTEIELYVHHCKGLMWKQK